MVPNEGFIESIFFVQEAPIIFEDASELLESSTYVGCARESQESRDMPLYH